MKTKFDYKIFILSMCLSFCVFLSVAQKVTLNAKDRPLIEILNAIKSQTGYNIFYNSKILENANKVTLKVTNENLDKVLAYIFYFQPLKYNVTNNTIVLRIDEDKILGTNHNYSNSTNLIKGEIVDVFKSPVEGVTIVNATSNSVKNNIALTDKNG